jgi:hypothetical protein
VSEQETYYLFVIEYNVDGDVDLQEHYVMRAESEHEAEMRVAHGLKTWCGADGIEADEDGIRYSKGLYFHGYVKKEVSWQFADECPILMRQFNFGSDYQPNLKDMAVKAIREAS